MNPTSVQGIKEFPGLNWGSEIEQFFNHGTPIVPQQGPGRGMQRNLKVLADSDGLHAYLAEKIYGLTEVAANWINVEALPLTFSDDLTLTWRQVMIDNTLAPEVPALGVPRQIHRGDTTYSVSSARYGVMVKFEQDRMHTAEGQEDFKRGMLQIAGIMMVRLQSKRTIATDAVDKLNAAHDAMVRLLAFGRLTQSTSAPSSTPTPRASRTRTSMPCAITIRFNWRCVVSAMSLWFVCFAKKPSVGGAQLTRHASGGPKG